MIMSSDTNSDRFKSDCLFYYFTKENLDVVIILPAMS